VILRREESENISFILSAQVRTNSHVSDYSAGEARGQLLRRSVTSAAVRIELPLTNISLSIRLRLRLGGSVTGLSRLSRTLSQSTAQQRRRKYDCHCRCTFHLEPPFQRTGKRKR
jgi:hypothetical protein